MPLLLPNGCIGSIGLEAISKHREWTGIGDTPLDSQGWTLQEYLLPPPIVFFNAYYLIWLCQTQPEMLGFDMRTSYTPVPVQRGVGRPLLLKSLLRGTFKELREGHATRYTTEPWTGVVVGYSGRKLKNWKDRLPALADIAGEFERMLNGVHLAGMWKCWLIRHLAWYIPEPSRTRRCRHLAGHGLCFQNK